MIEIGIDSFASNNYGSSVIDPVSDVQAMAELLERIQHADQCGLDIFGVGEHHRKDFLDSAPAVILASAASKTKQIRLTSAVAVLSAMDPVRLFQQYATLDLISNGRAEMVVGRGSFSEAFPLFGLSFNDYDDIFTEKLDLLLQIRNEETISWMGRFRPELLNQSIYPRPVQDEIPIWVGVGGTPESAIRAGTRGLPLMIAIIGGETRRFRRLVDIYYKAGLDNGFTKDQLKVGIHSLGYYNSQVSKFGALLVGSPREVADKVLQHSEDLGGLSRLTFQMNVAALSHQQLMNSIELIAEVKELIK